MIGHAVSHYQILERFGEGGMGVVYKAVDTILDRHVVLKFLHAEISGDPEIRERFVYEAKAAAALNHPNICTIHEIGTHETQPFIAMEFVEGWTVQQIIDTHFGTAKPTTPIGNLSLDGVLGYAMQIAEGLQAAHERKVIHRDIKPANILVTRRGQVKIMDFGLAKVMGRTKLTETGTLLGTLAYMAPEQLQGGAVDPRADLWSFGAVMYEMVTGRVPFSANYEAALMYEILNKAPEAPSELMPNLPADVERLILKCLCKDVEHRYASAQHLLRDLQSMSSSAMSDAVLPHPSTTSAAKRESERRHTTVLSATLLGYNELVHQLDPEEAASAMENCLDELKSAALQFQGTVEQATTNRITVLFGVPEAIEAAPRKAIMAANAMRKSIHQINQRRRLQTPLDLQIGIDTGVVIVGSASQQGDGLTFSGKPLVSADGLRTNAVKGQVLVGSLTHRHTKNDFDFGELPPVNVPGKDSVAVFELLSTEERVAPTPGSADRTIHSEMVGRDKEFDRLKLQVLKVINGEGSIVTVIGDAGIGKSRLIAELRKLEDIKKVALHQGRALSIGKNLSYHPIIDLIRSHVGIAEDTGEGEAHAKLERAIRDVYPEGVDEVFPFLATLMGMRLAGRPADRVAGIEGEAMEKLILKNLRELTTKWAEQRPIVYILQDLHWADQTSLNLLQSLYRLAESHPICFINVLRPNYPETSGRIRTVIRERYPNATVEIILQPLSEKQSDTLIRNLLKASIPPELRSSIAQKAEGNPFFIEEVMRSWIDDGALVQENGRFAVTKKIESVVIPETIQDVLMARVDRLDEETKSLLKHASVIGRYFFYKILADVVKQGSVDDHLDYLQGVQLILKSQRIEELEYLFKHALTQEVTYESILLKKRKELHLHVADAIESVFSDRLQEFYGMLAWHYGKGDNLEKAEHYLIKAGKEALKAAASSEALNHFQAALEIYMDKFGDSADPEKVAALEKSIGLALFNKGLMADAVHYFDRVLAHLGERRSRSKLGQIIDLVRIMFNIISYLYLPRRRKQRTPTPTENEMLALIEKRGGALVSVDTKRMFLDSVSILRLLNDLDVNKAERGPDLTAGGSILFSLTDFSLSLGEKILQSGEQRLDQRIIEGSTFGFYRTVHNAVTGHWASAELNDELVGDYLSQGELYAAGGLLIWSGLQFVEVGRYAAVQQCLVGLINIADTYDNDTASGRRYVLETRLLLRRRDLRRALQTADTGSQFIRSRKLHQYALWVAGAKPCIQVLMGDRAGARESIKLIDRELESVRTNLPAYLSGVLLSKCLLHLVEFENSLEKGLKTSSFRRSALRSARVFVRHARKYAPDRTEAAKLMGVYYWLINRQQRALKWWSKSIQVGEQLGARPELARTYFEIGKRLLEPGSKHGELEGTSADGFLDKARVAFEELDLQWDLGQLVKVQRESQAGLT